MLGKPVCRTASSHSHHTCSQRSSLSCRAFGLRHFGFATEFNQHFEQGEFLGRGTFGEVHSATSKSTGDQVAVKSIRKRFLGSYMEPSYVKRVQHEVDVYGRVGASLNVAHLYAVYENDHHVLLVLQLCKGGELWSRIVKHGAYSEREAARTIAEILRAVAQCHARGIIVRDIKPQNFLFLRDTADSPLKLVDFGMADYCTESQSLKDRAGTPVYCAPEVLRQNYGLKSDVWSAGVCAYELLASRLPFKDTECADQGSPDSLLSPDLKFGPRGLTKKEIFAATLNAPLDFELEPWPQLSAGAKDFVQKLLERDPDQRPTALEALAHPWLQEALATSGISDFFATSGADSDGPSSRGSSKTEKLEYKLPDRSLGSRPAFRAEAGTTQGGGSAASGQGRRGVSKGSQSMSPRMSPMDSTLVARLQRFGTYVRLKQALLSRMVGLMTYADVGELEQLRQALGVSAVDPLPERVPYAKLVSMLSSGDFDLSQTEIRQLLSSFHPDADGAVSLNEWLAALTDWQLLQGTPEWEQLVGRVFDEIDTEQSGRLGFQDLEALLCDPDGCPYEDTVPAALRGAAADMLLLLANEREGPQQSASNNTQLDVTPVARPAAPAVVRCETVTPAAETSAVGAGEVTGGTSTPLAGEEAEATPTWVGTSDTVGAIMTAGHPEAAEAIEAVTGTGTVQMVGAAMMAGAVNATMADEGIEPEIETEVETQTALGPKPPRTPRVTPVAVKSVSSSSDSDSSRASSSAGGTQAVPPFQVGELVLDKIGLTHLLRMARQDGLELFETRARPGAPVSTGSTPAATE